MNAGRTLRVDAHAHVFVRGLPMVEGRRYTPEHDAPPTAYLGLLDAHDIDHAVLVQPSILGTDNRFMCDVIGRSDGRLRGIAVVDPSIDDAGLDALAASGIVGVRYSLFDMDVGQLAEPAWRGLTERLAAREWIIEFLAEGADLPAALEAVWPSGARVVVDHFGIPDARLGTDDPGFRAILERAASGRLWVKLSGAYRSGADAHALAEALLEAFGPGRMMWGSDWPWTQFQDAGFTYVGTLDWLAEWVPDEGPRRTILGETAGELYGFG